MLPDDHDGTVILGKRKKGKTTLLKNLIRDEPRVILYDAKGELTESTEILPGEIPILPPVGVFRGYIPAGDNPLEELEWAAYIAALLGRCVFVVDELADALENRPHNPGRWFKWVTRMGRKRGVRFVYCSQRPQEIPRQVTSQASDWYVLQTNEPNELQYLRLAIGTDAAIRVRNLKRGHSLHVKDGDPFGLMHAEPF